MRPKEETWHVRTALSPSLAARQDGQCHRPPARSSARPSLSNTVPRRESAARVHRPVERPEALSGAWPPSPHRSLDVCQVRRRLATFCGQRTQQRVRRRPWGSIPRNHRQRRAALHGGYGPPHWESPRSRPLRQGIRCSPSPSPRRELQAILPFRGGSDAGRPPLRRTGVPMPEHAQVLGTPAGNRAG